MFILLILGCAKATPVATPAALKPGTVAPVLKVDVPTNVERLRGLLMARHAEDLPDKAVMDQHNAPEALQWLAENDELLLVRSRALHGLRHYTDTASQQVCRGVFDSDAYAKLRAASITCLQGSDLMADSTLRNKLLAALRDPDPRVGLAAVHVLAEVPAAKSGLKAALEDSAVIDLVRTEVEAVVGG